ncbi:DNA (cytosine-5-)-methyltransferase [Paenisporosarcina antarctica]|uniref:Cytosine-specific methyltransferase n=1 Tax=Paenisporosarcina antarctica TaxID=417367 RepID=A0A4P6ZU25_9BACL|nr:DNA (cytosine-5-)-methyltransferase [Paenisporosarcina antarctica]QBP39717.1 DNA (cytosine-5-)-methyltransferase [Paenisporosarcina antarctica]
MQNSKINVIELFAGVGGFRLGLEKANPDLFKIVWGNQWEPARKAQDAFDCYVEKFNNGIHSNEDITKVSDETFVDLEPNLVVGGFPCQDYSVARTLSGEKGLQGKKGVLFWEIKRVIENTQPKYVLLENVDRLLKSPSSQRGRDFAVMLATFRDLNYTVEWRVINAADYGFAQRRRRVFIFAYKNGIAFDQFQSKYSEDQIVFNEGFFAKPFPVEFEPYKDRITSVALPNDIVSLSDNFSFGFHTAGYMKEGQVFTTQVIPKEEKPVTLRNILIAETEVDEKFYLSEATSEKFSYLRGPKKIERKTADGHVYQFSEGGMSPVDDLDKPGRTMLTSEGSTNRSTHIIEVNGRKRFLTPLECERLNGFDDNWTSSMSDRMRYFCMGNALVVGLIERLGLRIEEIEKTNILTDVQLKLALQS